MTERVWILGSGFSKSLGGPLLADLLSLKTRGELEVLYAKNEDLWKGDTAIAVYGMFHYGMKYPEGWIRKHGRGEQIWANAEQYLDFLDRAQDDPDRPGGFWTSRLKQLWARYRKDVGLSTGISGMPRPEGLLRAAKQILAAECCMFRRNANMGLEAWHPYSHWAAQLNHADTVVSFNYDLVFEDACARAGQSPYVVTFGRPKDEQLLFAETMNRPILIKLHGSVDWKYVPGRAPLPFEPAGVDHGEYVVRVNDEEEPLAIATPGPSKGEATGSDFKCLWDLAVEKLETAEVIVFLGYSFPQTDSLARLRLIGPMTKRPSDEKDLSHRPRQRP